MSEIHVKKKSQLKFKPYVGALIFIHHKADLAKCQGAYEEKGANEGQICVKRGLLRFLKSLDEEKGAYKTQNDGNWP